MRIAHRTGTDTVFRKCVVALRSGQSRATVYLKSTTCCVASVPPSPSHVSRVSYLSHSLIDSGHEPTFWTADNCIVTARAALRTIDPFGLPRQRCSGSCVHLAYFYLRCFVLGRTTSLAYPSDMVQSLWFIGSDVRRWIYAYLTRRNLSRSPVATAAITLCYRINSFKKWFCLSRICLGYTCYASTWPTVHSRMYYPDHSETSRSH